MKIVMTGTRPTDLDVIYMLDLRFSSQSFIVSCPGSLPVHMWRNNSDFKSDPTRSGEL